MRHHALLLENTFYNQLHTENEQTEPSWSSSLQEISRVHLQRSQPVSPGEAPADSNTVSPMPGALGVQTLTGLCALPDPYEHSPPGALSHIFNNIYPGARGKHAWHTLYVRLPHVRSEDSLPESLLFCHVGVGLGIRTQAIRLCSKRLYLLSHFPSAHLNFRR